MYNWKTILGWRISRIEGARDLSCVFDPYTERLLLRDLTEDEKSGMLDTEVSVSAVDRIGPADFVDPEKAGESKTRQSFRQLSFLKKGA